MKLLINLAILFLCCIGVSGQTYRKEICVGFRVSSSEIDLDYGDNASNLAEIVGLLTDVQRNPNMEITGRIVLRLGLARRQVSAEQAACGRQMRKP